MFKGPVILSSLSFFSSLEVFLLEENDWTALMMVRSYSKK